MLQSLQRFLTLCTPEDKRRLWVLLLVVVSTGVLEVAGIASILPFLQLAADPDSVADNQFLQKIFDFFDLQSHQARLLATGWAVIVFLGVSNLFTALGSWQRVRVAWAVAHHVSVALATSYAALPYGFFLGRDAGDIIKSVIDDVNSLVDGVVIAGCRLVSQLIVSSMIIALIIFINPLVALIAMLVFFGPYTIMTLLRRRYLTGLGQQRVLANSRRFITFSDLIVGIKAIKSADASQYFVDRFEAPSKLFSDIQPKLHISSILPRYILESIAFGSVVAMIMYLNNRSVNLVEVLPVLTLFTLAGYRLMPSANTAYISMVQLLSSYPAIDNIYWDVNARPSENHSESAKGSSALLPSEMQPSSDVASGSLVFQKNISLQEMGFSYKSMVRPVLDSITLRIEKGEKVAFVGPSGSGKTTLVDILVGLLEPTEGALLVDATRINATNLDSLKSIVGYVPQDVFLYNETVAGNVAFGETTVDLQRVKHSCRIAELDGFIQNELEVGYETEVGDRGLRLSGGQRQRIGLARALYRQPDILVLDEATSALDTVTEKAVVSNILNDLPNVTIIMIAHRLSTVRQCDRLFVLDRGQLVAEGTYDELVAGNSVFRELASIS